MQKGLSHRGRRPRLMLKKRETNNISKFQVAPAFFLIYLPKYRALIIKRLLVRTLKKKEKRSIATTATFKYISKVNKIKTCHLSRYYISNFTLC